MAVIDQKITDEYALYNGDCIETMQTMPDECMHFSIYSPPFGGLYNYSSDPRDISNNDSYDGFFDHYGYCVSEVARITMPGRCTAVHCTDIPSGNTGSDYLIDLPGDIIRLHEKHGFQFIARHTIWKEPLWVRNRTMCKNLAHQTVVEDAAKAGVASADYLLIFRKKGENKIPIANPTGLDHYAGECPMPDELLKLKNHTGKQTENSYSHWIWRRYASSVWDDIKMYNTSNDPVMAVLPFQDSKDPDDEKHVHPLQLQVIDRAVCLRTNRGETVFTPFMGVGSEVFGAVSNGRKGIGVELKTSYYKQAVLNMDLVKSRYDVGEQQLFELIDTGNIASKIGNEDNVSLQK